MPQPIVKTLEDINNDSLTKVFGQYFNQAQDVKATIDGDFGGFGGTNDNYNSEIKRLTVIVKRNEDQVEKIGIVFKLPVSSPFLRRTQKFARPLMKEVRHKSMKKL